MYTIGLTGGIASGKSTVTNMLRRLGASIIDCDVIAHDVVMPGSKGLAAVAAAFGPKTIRPDGTMDRAYIGDVVFHDKSQKAVLEGILFPLIQEEINRQIKEIGTQEKKNVAFLDMPLLFEVKYDSYVNEAWLVYVDGPTQLQRLMSRDGYTEEAAMARIHSQFPIDKKKALADVIIDNRGSMEETETQVQKAWSDLTARVDRL